jgi:hypothetical protein
MTTNSFQFDESFNLAKIEPEIQKTKKLIAFLQFKLDKNIRKKKTFTDLQIAKNHLQILLRDREIATNVKPIDPSPKTTATEFITTKQSPSRLQ